MSLALIGLLVGLAFALAEYVLFSALIRRAAARGEVGRGPVILDWVRKAQIIVYPLIGWLVGRFVAAQSGV
jgi:hypothetical protein